MSSVRKSERDEGTRARVPFGAKRYRLQLSDADMEALENKGYVVRWFNDRDGRIERALAGGYQFCTPDEAPSVGHAAIGETNTDVGDKVSKIVSRGDPVIRAFLMKIKKKYYDEDQAVKEEVNQRVDEALRGGGSGGEQLGEHGYGPGVTYQK